MKYPHSLLVRFTKILGKRRRVMLAGLMAAALAALLFVVLGPEPKQTVAVTSHKTAADQTPATVASATQAAEQTADGEANQSVQAVTHPASSAPASKPAAKPATTQPEPCPLPGVSAADCAKAIAEQKTPSPTGQLLVSDTYFEMYAGDNITDAFSAWAADGTAIMAPGNAWSPTPAPVSVVQYFYGTPPPSGEKRTSWTMNLNAYIYANPGTYTFEIVAGDGITLYKTNITVVILPEPEEE